METTEEKVKKIFLKVFDKMPADEFSFEKKQAEYTNWDSFAHMQLLSEVENKMKITFDIEEAVKIESAQNIVDLIKKKLNIEGK